MAISYGQPEGSARWMEAMISVDLLANDIGDRDATWFGSVVFGHDSGWYFEVLLDH